MRLALMCFDAEGLLEAFSQNIVDMYIFLFHETATLIASCDGKGYGGFPSLSDTISSIRPFRDAEAHRTKNSTLNCFPLDNAIMSLVLRGPRKLVRCLIRLLRGILNGVVDMILILDEARLANLACVGFIDVKTL